MHADIPTTLDGVCDGDAPDQPGAEGESSFAHPSSDPWQWGAPPTRSKTLAEALDQARAYELRIITSQTFPESVLAQLVPPGGLWDQWTMHAQRNPVLSLFYIPHQVKELRSILSSVQQHLVRLFRQAMDNHAIRAAVPAPIFTVCGRASPTAPRQ
jgi:hypothetical protein